MLFVVWFLAEVGIGSLRCRYLEILLDDGDYQGVGLGEQRTYLITDCAVIGRHKLSGIRGTFATDHT